MKLIEKNKASVLIDGQWGSTGKGLAAAWFAQQIGNEVAIATTNASSNAGHTTCYASGRKFITFHLPTFAVVQNCPAYLNAGSVIDVDLLFKELEEVGFDKRKLYIHPNAAVISPEDKLLEADAASSATRISSTQKGVGTALSRKIRREAKLAKDHPLLKDFIKRIDLNGKTCMVEVPQGYSLSLNSGYSYPYVTSREVTVAAGLSDAGIHPEFYHKSVMTLRSLPIRVGSIEGHTSGPHYPDQRELTWTETGQTPELTTVTKRVRRIFTFSRMQYEEALRALRPDFVFCNFLNYLTPEEGDNWTYEMMQTEIEAGLQPRKIWGIGPNVEDVFINYNDAIEAMIRRN